MPEITFIFGPNNTFFFDCPKSWKFHGIPQTLRQLFNSSMSPAWRIAQPFCLALGPQVNSPEPIWYVGCKVCDGQEKIFYSQTYFDINYPDLSRWTKGIPNAPRACFVTFGQNLSYFASAPGHGSIWAGIPSDLSDKVQKAYDTPSCVALGVKNAWFVMWPDGYYSWKFHGNYAGLDKILTEAEPRSVSYLAISPYNKEHYFVAFRDRSVKYNFTGCPEWMPLMQEVFSQWQTEIAQRQWPYQQLYPRANAPPPQQQWAQYQPQPRPPNGYLSSQTPNTPLSTHSTPTSPPFSPNNVYRNPPPQPPPRNSMIEMPNTLLAAPPVTIPRSSSTDKKKGFLSKLVEKSKH